MPSSEIDDPKEIVGGCIRAQREMLIGYKGERRVEKEKLEEAMLPKHAAISLAGEPCIYPRLGELIEEFHRLGMTTFLVTNGTFPERLAKLTSLPTQLYLTLPAPNEKVYRKTCDPLIVRGWKKLKQTLELFPSLGTRKVIRLTLVKGLNLMDAKAYSKLIQKASPHFVEVKGYVFVGFSRLRLSYRAMPSHEEIKGFAELIAKETGYELVDEKKDSRVVLLSSGEERRIIGGLSS
jgi:tRNA wybutosine-synthesizing protein 1